MYGQCVRTGRSTIVCMGEFARVLERGRGEGSVHTQSVQSHQDISREVEFEREEGREGRHTALLRLKTIITLTNTIPYLITSHQHPHIRITTTPIVALHPLEYLRSANSVLGVSGRLLIVVLVALIPRSLLIRSPSLQMKSAYKQGRGWKETRDGTSSDLCSINTHFQPYGVPVGTSQRMDIVEGSS